MFKSATNHLLHPHPAQIYMKHLLKNPLIYELLLKRISDLAKKKAPFSIANIFPKECCTRFSLALKSTTYEENTAEYITLRQSTAIRVRARYFVLCLRKNLNYLQFCIVVLDEDNLVFLAKYLRF
jgi:hypothetical protein